MQVEYNFSVNDVRFNSGLNLDFADALLYSDGNEYELIAPFVAEYELNHR